MPDTVEDDGEGSEGTPSDDVESAAPIENNKGVVKFGWIKGVLVSWVGLRWACFIGTGSLWETVAWPVEALYELHNTTGLIGPYKARV